jgi:O-antigen ligase
MFCGAVAASFLVGRLHNLVWGDGSQDSSNQARIDQWILGVPKLLHHPYGYGIGMSADVLGYKSFGTLTIDSYYLAILLEEGIVGFILYYGMILATIYYCTSTLWKRRSLVGETGLLAPIAIALSAFFVEKSVFSEQDNHPLVFMMMGMAAALAYRTRMEEPPVVPKTRPALDRPGARALARASALRGA